MAPRKPLTDAEHAVRIRQCADELNDVIGEATSDGLVVRIDIEAGHGMVRGQDRTTMYPKAVLGVWRPL